jgi:RHS repeat-associated protein
MPQPFGWKGREFVPGPNLYFNRARFYDLVLGRFLSEDPLGVNTHAYVGAHWLDDA